MRSEHSANQSLASMVTTKRPSWELPSRCLRQKAHDRFPSGKSCIPTKPSIWERIRRLFS